MRSRFQDNLSRGIFCLCAALAGFIAIPCSGQIEPETVLAKSSAGEVTFAEVAEDWPYLGSPAEQTQVVRDVLKQHIYAAEAEREKIDQGPQYEQQINNARLSAFLEALFYRDGKDVSVTDGDVQASYERKRSLYFLDEHVFLRHIALRIPIPSDAASRLQTKTRAIEVLARLRQGESFRKVAEEQSDDRRNWGYGIGPIPTRDLAKVWSPEVSRLGPGETSGVVEREDRFEIVQILQRRPAGVPSPEELRPAIRARLQRERNQDAKKQFLAKLIQEVPGSTDHQAIDDPDVKGDKTVVSSKYFKMTKAEYEQWVAGQSAASRRSLRDPLQREAIVRRDILLKAWVGNLAKKKKLDKDPAFQKEMERQRRAILAQRFEEYLFNQNPSFLTVTDADVQEYYAAHRSQFETPQRAEIRDVVITADTAIGDSPQARSLAFRYAKELAQDVSEKIRCGTVTFEMAALQHRATFDPGAFFTVERGTEGELFDAVVFKLEPGQLSSEPILTDEGYRIVQLSKILPAVQLPLSRVRNRIERILQQDKTSRLRRRLEELYFQKAQAVLYEQWLLSP